MLIAMLLILSAIHVPVGTFQTIELDSGGHVIVRHGAVQRVSIVEGDLHYTRVRVDNGRLVIERTDEKRPRGYALLIEVETPRLSGVFVSNGGRIRAEGDFPAQASIKVGVEQGGSIDIRAIAADDVDASVYSGGGILTTCEKSLNATVRSGGAITYTGEVNNVRKSIRDGGSVKRED